MKKGIGAAPLRVGVFSRMREADRAVEGLVKAGFDHEKISVICPTCPPEKYREYQRAEPAGAQALPAALGGGAIGTVLGGLAAAGAAATGGMGLLAVGPLLLSAGTGALTGGLIGAMLSRGLEKEDANYYSQAVQGGKVLVSVEYEGADQDERLAVAESVFREAGAEPVPLEKG